MTLGADDHDRPSRPSTLTGKGGQKSRVSFLDQALWRRFAESGELAEHLQVWLGLQCRIMGEDASGVLVIGDPQEKDYRPVSVWPDEEALSPALSTAAERALAEGRGVATGFDENGGDGPRRCAVGYPVIVDDETHGAVALEIHALNRGKVRAALRQLQWGVGNVVSVLRREELLRQRAEVERVGAVFNLLSEALEKDRFDTACNAVVTELAVGQDCDQVSIGFRRRRRISVRAISNSVQFGKRMSLIRDIGRAMDEAVDQQAVVLYPPRGDWDFRVDRDHAELSSLHGDATVLTVPILANGRFVGALTAERHANEGFDSESIELFDCVAGVVGPILEEKRRNDRWIVWKLFGALGNQVVRLLGPRYLGRKVATLIIAGAVAFLATATGTFRVTAPATVQGAVERAIVAPLDGYIYGEHVRAGEIVEEGAVMAELDRREMIVERLRWETERDKKATEYDQALAEHKRAEATVIRSEMEQAESQIRLLEIQIARTTLRAPFDGIVLAGDLSQRIGGSVKRGEEIFRVSPLNAYRVHLEIDERDIAELEPGQRGKLIVSSFPETPHPFTVQRVTPVSESREGRTFFRVEAELEDPNPRLRPGMSGVAKTEVDERLLVLIWGDRLIDWFRVFAWKWLP